MPFDRGRDCARRAKLGYDLGDVANSDGEGLKEVRTASDFANDAGGISHVCGGVVTDGEWHDPADAACLANALVVSSCEAPALQTET